MNFRYRCIIGGPSLSVLLGAWIFFCTGAIGQADVPRIAIVVGEQAPALERYAADELKAMFQRLYQVQAAVETQPPTESDYVILLGQDSTNQHVTDVLPQPTVELSDQGLMLQTIDPARLVVRGGSPIATLWAAYELGEQMGVRYLSDRDVYRNDSRGAVATPARPRRRFSSAF